MVIDVEGLIAYLKSKGVDTTKAEEFLESLVSDTPEAENAREAV
jgi:hypothetical protein